MLATQNPIESDGTYLLPEAQFDRFMFKVLVDYPSYQEELVVVQRVTGPRIELKQLLTPTELMALQQRADQVYVDPRVVAYAATLVHATREPAAHQLDKLSSAILYGASPRASINLVAGARALGLMQLHRVDPRVPLEKQVGGPACGLIGSAPAHLSVDCDGRPAQLLGGHGNRLGLLYSRIGPSHWCHPDAAAFTSSEWWEPCVCTREAPRALKQTWRARWNRSIDWHVAPH